jgi:MarC family integral membrane protein
VVAGFDGFVANYMGDGVLVFFGYPRAHEDDAERAVRAGLGLIDAVSRLDVKSARLQAHPVVLLTDNNRFSLAEESLTAVLTAAVLVVVLILLLLAARIQRYLGAAGIMVITQIMGLVLAAYSVQQVLDGVVKVFGRAGH